MLVEMSVSKFCEVLASDAPAPGGGSVAALSGTLSASLLAMVCRLSIGKKEYAEFERDLRDSLDLVEKLKARLLHRIDLDTEAFNGVMAAFKLPKSTDEEKATRGSAIQRGYMDAVQSPLEIARECLNILQVADQLIGKTNVNALSDLGVASDQARAGLEGAAMNVCINLPSIKNLEFVTKTRSEIDQMRRIGAEINGRIQDYCWAKLS